MLFKRVSWALDNFETPSASPIISSPLPLLSHRGTIDADMSYDYQYEFAPHGPYYPSYGGEHMPVGAANSAGCNTFTNLVGFSV